MAQVKADGSVEDPRESIDLLFWDWFSNLSCLRRRVISGWITQDFEYHFKFELEDEEEEEEKEEEEEEEEEEEVDNSVDDDSVTVFISNNNEYGDDRDYDDNGYDGDDDEEGKENEAEEEEAAKDVGRQNGEVNAVDDNGGTIHVSTPNIEEKNVVARPGNYGKYFYGENIPELVAEWKKKLDLSDPNHSYTEDDIERAVRFDIGWRNFKLPPIHWSLLNVDGGFSQPLEFFHNPVELPWDDEDEHENEDAFPAGRKKEEARESEDSDAESLKNPYQFDVY